MNTEKFFWYILSFVLVASMVGIGVGFSTWRSIEREKEESARQMQDAFVKLVQTRIEVAARKEIREERARIEAALQAEKRNPLFVASPKPDMEKMKHLGCVADGFLSDYGKESGDMIKYINGSKCYYLHRALETWLDTPDFDQAAEIKKKVKKDDALYGMFLAEAIDRNAKYFYPEENRYFRFSDMCRKGTENRWGEHTCVPSFESEEYRKYLREITRQAMDMGIQSFLFGQIQLQKSRHLDPAWARIIVTDMRVYAEWLGTDIVIGAQTNDIDDPIYLSLFDYIEGGVGIDAQGNFPERSECHPRWWQREGDWCWALLRNDRFARKAKNVLIHLDWSGKRGDDMSHFTRMSAEGRASTLRTLYDFFTGRGDGFLLPVLARLSFDNNGCSGVTKHFYSPQNKFGCDDEQTIDDIFSTWLKKE
jgi:hypothetical protein